MPKVYVANLGGHDVSDAKRFGELVFLTTRGYKPKDLERVAFEVTGHLQRFNPDEDYFLPVGQDLLNLTCMWVLAKKFDTIPVLFWEFRERRYLPKTFSPRLLEQVMENLKLREEIEKNVRFTSYFRSN